MGYANPQLLIEPEELAERLGEERLRVFDSSIRISDDGLKSGREDYLRSHVKGAAFVDLFSDVSEPAGPGFMTLPGAEFLERALREVGVDAQSEIVVYSRVHSMWATRLWWILHYAGHENVRVLHGGLGAWTDAGFPVAAGEERYPPGDFRVRPRAGLWADKEQVLKAIGDGSVCTVHTLSEELYLGEGRQHYARPGHITGSVHLAYDELMNRDRFRPANELASVLHAKGLVGAERVITYCGGGVAATIDAFACLLVGKEDVAVYDGSLMEWTADASLPMTTGPKPGP